MAHGLVPARSLMGECRMIASGARAKLSCLRTGSERKVSPGGISGVRCRGLSEQRGRRPSERLFDDAGKPRSGKRQALLRNLLRVCVVGR